MTPQQLKKDLDNVTKEMSEANRLLGQRKSATVTDKAKRKTQDADVAWWEQRVRVCNLCRAQLAELCKQSKFSADDEAIYARAKSFFDSNLQSLDEGRKAIDRAALLREKMMQEAGTLDAYWEHAQKESTAAAKKKTAAAKPKGKSEPAPVAVEKIKKDIDLVRATTSLYAAGPASTAKELRERGRRAQLDIQRIVPSDPVLLRAQLTIDYATASLATMETLQAYAVARLVD